MWRREYLIAPIVEGHGEVEAVPALLNNWFLFRRFVNFRALEKAVRAPGTAIRMLCEGQVVSRSPWAMLLAPCAPPGHLVSRPSYDGGGRASTRDASAQPTLGEVLQQWIDVCRTDPEGAAHMRQWLLAGYRRHADPETYVDHLLTELGIPIVPTVTFF